MKKIIGFALFSIFYISCQNTNDKENISISKKVLSDLEYSEVYNQLNDTIKLWIDSKLESVQAESLYEYKIDSLLCVNKFENRLISCRHLYVNVKGAIADDLQFLYGEKINGEWYFFRGASIVIPRTMVKNHPISQPLSYKQLHQIALKEVYGGYLLPNGEINEEWFTTHFEGLGWGDFNKQENYDWFLKGKRYKTSREFYEQAHLVVVGNNWNGVKKDSIVKIQS